MAKISRRGFLGKLGNLLATITVTVAAPGCFTPSLEGMVETIEPERRQSVKPLSPKELADFLRSGGVEPQVYDFGGDRTLLVLGDFHVGAGGTYNAFFDLLSKRYGNAVDPIFMEFVYAKSDGRDPHYAREVDVSKIRGKEPLSFEKFKEIDGQGYYELSRKFNVKGIEDPVLAHDAEIACEIAGDVFSLIKSLYQYDKEKKAYIKNPEVEMKIRELQSQLKVVNFPLPDNYPDQVSRADRRRIIKEGGVITNHIVGTEKNRYLAGYLDSQLGHNKLGGLVVGMFHVEPDPFYNDILLPSLLKEKGINVVYINIFSLGKFLERQGVPEETLKPRT